MTEALSAVVSSLNLNHYFPGLDKDLLRLALTTKGQSLPTEVVKHLESKYHLSQIHLNHDMLKFYGDTALTLLFLDRYKDQYGLDVNPKVLFDIKSDINKSSTLTNFTKQLGLAGYLSQDNLYADVFQAIVGVIYYQYGLTNLSRIRNWLFSLTPVSDFFEQQATKLYRRNQEDLVSANYIKRMKWDKQESVRSFFNAYFTRDGNLRLRTEKVHDDMYAYFIYYTSEEYKFYLDTIPNDEIEELKSSLIDKSIWQ